MNRRLNAAPGTLPEELRRRAEELVRGGHAVILAVDGRCGSGKTGLGNALGRAFGCPVVHTDDYYLPFDRRPEGWRSVPAANMDFARLRAEVLDPWRAGQNTAKEAVNRACQLIEELGAGEVIGGIIDIYSQKREENRVPFDPEKINRLLGTDIAEDTMISYFKKIDLDYDPCSKEVIVPTWRQDLYRMAEQIPATVPAAGRQSRRTAEGLCSPSCGRTFP